MQIIFVDVLAVYIYRLQHVLVQYGFPQNKHVNIDD